MPLQENQLAAAPERSTCFGDTTGGESCESDPHANDSIARISNSSLQGMERISIFDDGILRKPRAKHIPLGRLAGHSVAVPNGGSAFGGSGGGEGIGGEGGGGGGRDRKNSDEFMQIIGTVSDASDNPDESGQGGDEDSPDPDEVGKEASVHDPRLILWAKENGVEYIEPSGYEDAHSKFVNGKFFRHVTRKSKIAAVKEQLGDDVTCIRMFQLNIKSALMRANSRTFSADGEGPAREGHEEPHQMSRRRKRILSKVLLGAFEMLKGSMPQSSRSLISEELTGISDMIHALRNSYSRNQEMKIVEAASKMEGILRYKMEAREGTYRSINLTPDSLMQLVDVSGLKELLLADEDNLNSICDFGCGDGETLIQLAAQVPIVLDLKGNALTDAKIKELSMERYQTDNPSYWEGREIEDVVLPQIQEWKKNISSQVKTKFRGIDQATHFIERLRDRKGVGGVVADLCVPTKQFLEDTGIEPNSVKIGISSLTIDRARDVDQLLSNISMTMADDGTLVLLTKSTHSSRTDGASASGDPFSQIDYSGKTDLKTKDRIQLLDALKPRLEKHGLKVVRVGRHHGKVVSTDVSANNVQTYRLLAIVCKKMPLPEPPPALQTQLRKSSRPPAKPFSKPSSSPPKNED